MSIYLSVGLVSSTFCRGCVEATFLLNLRSIKQLSQKAESGDRTATDLFNLFIVADYNAYQGIRSQVAINKNWSVE